MLEKINFESVLFLDIETVPMTSAYDEMPEIFRKLWGRKTEMLNRYESEGCKSPGEMFERAGIYAEFGKIICISTAIYRKDSLWMRSFYGDDEKELLMEFSSYLDKINKKNTDYLCAHNGREFDYPYMIRRMLVNDVPVPGMLDICMKKSWELSHLLDTMDLWKFGDYKSYTSLELMAALFNIPTPKDDICGADVARVFYEEKNLASIVEYCQKDVLTIVNIFRKMQGKSVLKTEEVMVA